MLMQNQENETVSLDQSFSDKSEGWLSTVSTTESLVIILHFTWLLQSNFYC